MAGPYKEYSVHLHRDALSTPWGFRLQGGKDFKAPLTIQRVFVGSPADGELHRGDVIVSIDNCDGSSLFHKQAQDIIKRAGGTLAMRVKRGATSYESQRLAPAPAAQPVPQFYRGPGLAGPAATAGALAFVPKPRQLAATSPDVPSFGTDYSKKGRFSKQVPPVSSNMLSRVQQSLNAAIWQPGDEEYDPEYEPRTVADRRRDFIPPQQTAPQGHRYSPQDMSGRRHGTRECPGPRPYQPAQPAQPAHQSRTPPPSIHLQPATTDEDDYEQISVSKLKNVFSPRPAERQDEAGYQSVKDRKKLWAIKGSTTTSTPKRSNRPPPPPQIDLLTEEEGDSRMPGRPSKPWTKPDPSMYAGAPSQDYGWSPQKPDDSPGAGWSPARGTQGGPRFHHPQHRPPPQPQPQPYHVPHIDVPDVPAWAGSLRSGGGVKSWEVAAAAAATHDDYGRPIHRGPRVPIQQHQPVSPQPQQQVGLQQQQQQQQQPRTRSPHPEAGGSVQPHQPRIQNVHYAPGQDPEYQQHGADDHSGTPTVAHLQYNTPLGMYSRDNVDEALRGQTMGKPGEGTLQVTGGGPPGKREFDPSHSAVLRMLQEQESAPAKRVDQSARYAQHDHGQEMQYQGYMDHYKQSPSMHALETNMGGMDMGTSDF